MGQLCDKNLCKMNEIFKEASDDDNDDKDNYGYALCQQVKLHCQQYL